MNTIYLRRRNKVLLPPPAGEGELLPLHYVATALKNIEALGYSFSEPLIEACRLLSLEQLVSFYAEDLVPTLKALKGAHQVHQPMYPNFPKQVMELSKAQLYLNAIVHYWSGGKLFPVSEHKERFPLLDNVTLTQIELGTISEFEGLFGMLVGANASLSEQDKEDLTWFVATYGDAIAPLLPEAVPQKESMAFLAGLLLQHTSPERALGFVGRFVKTATDVLRLAVSLSGGDVSLAQACKFRTFSRPERRLLLGLLERQGNPLEDMLRWKGRWVRLGEKLHPGEHAVAYPKTLVAFQALRNDTPVATFNHKVETSLAAKQVADAVALLGTRPGELARRLDHLLRLDESVQDTVLGAFAQAAPNVATPVLLQVRHHFQMRNTAAGLRVFFPKGSLAKAQGIENTLPKLALPTCMAVVNACEAALLARFASLPSLGKVYLDPALAHYLVPFAQRSASRSLRTLVRGSKLPLPVCEVLRFFVWWKNGADRTDIDLSATLFDDAFQYKDILSYYNLKGVGGVHSGDIVDAPEGASEFIDITLGKVRESGVRYVVMSLNSYTAQPFVELPECFAGWMARQKPGSGEIYEPRTVQDRLDLTADTRIALPLVIDVVANQVIWCDLALRKHPRWHNNVHTNLSGIQLSLRALVEMSKPNLYDLLALHTQARGEWVESPEAAETIFSVAAETPFHLEELATRYLG